MSLIDHAKLYAVEWNFAVFPVHWIREDSTCSCGRAACRSAGKHPLTADGFKSATRELKQIEAWWRGSPEANIGIATGKISGIVVLDVDPRHGGFDSLNLYSMPLTMKAKTGGGGEHYYFRCPAGRQIRNSAGKLGAGLDVRGEGGYVVAPPSNHLLGVYEWEFWEEIAEMPEELYGARASCPQSLPPGKLNSPNIIRAGALNAGRMPALQGTRNSTLASLAGSMRSKGFSGEAIAQALLVENRSRCEPPLEDAEVKGIARSIARYKRGEFGESSESRESGESGESGESRGNNRTHDSPDSPDSPLLKVWNLHEFLSQSFEAKETVCFEAGRGDLAMLAARTNGGKSTLLRNCLLSLAVGREFAPFVPRQRPRRVMLLDFEADEADLQRDLATMTRGFSAIDHEFLGENFMLVPRGMIGGEMLQLNYHFNFVRSLIQAHLIEVIVIDNISSAFSLYDENSNAEVTRKVVKPLLKLASASGAAVVFAHHIGKASEASREDVYLSRGASTLSCLAKTVFNLRGRIDLNEAAEIACVKRKNGPNYSAAFRLNTDTRWFEPCEQSAPARRATNYDLIVGWLRENAPFGKPVKTSQILEAFPRISRANLMRNINEALSVGEIFSPKRAFYSAPQQISD
jgi:hypothetical protein